MSPVVGEFEITLTGEITRMMALSMPEDKTRQAVLDEIR